MLTICSVLFLEKQCVRTPSPTANENNILIDFVSKRLHVCARVHFYFKYEFFLIFSNSLIV